jgi:hypothetical protein
MSAQRSLIRCRKLNTPSAPVVGTLLTAALFLFYSSTSASAVEPPNVLVPTTIAVPLTLRDSPFDQDRVLMVPPGCKISVVVRINGARFIMPLSTGEFLVAQPLLGSIYSFGLKPMEREAFPP